ncbi:MAG TPA: hypothetical protein VD866_13440 [Urbifossiella sp.]|nr:hypothetical protein [Urbifossiella sp.]
MADRPKPIVRLIMIATRAGVEPLDNDRVLRNPLTRIDAGRFPWREDEVAVYAQLSGGLGRWELAVEFGERLDGGLFRPIGPTRAFVLDFGPAARLAVWEADSPFRRLPFRREGLYAFRMVGRPAGDPDDTAFEVLEGIHPGIPAVAELRVLAQGGRP